MIAEKIKNRIHQKLVRHIRAKHEMIDVLPKQGCFNHKCFLNAAEYQRRFPNTEIYEVICIEDDYPVLHYVNYCPSRDEYLETTLGFMADRNEYYKLRKINPRDYLRIDSEFSRTRDEWNSRWLPWWGRWLGVKTIV